MPGNDRISPDVTDISSVDQLLAYATAGQLEYVRGRVSQGKIAQAAGFGANVRSSGAALSAGLRHGLPPRQLARLDEVIGTLAPEATGAGGLSSLALRLSGGWKVRSDTSLVAHLPPNWVSKILSDPPSGETGVLVQASALLSAFMTADKVDAGGSSVSGIRDLYRQEMDLMVPRLILISLAPPTPRSYDAQTILGSLASYAFEALRDRLEYELRHSPLGFRVWWAISKLVTLSQHGEHAEALRSWVRRLIRDAEDLREHSLDPGSSLDLELALTIPAAWSPPANDWVGEALFRRTMNSEATIRERSTAAMGLWQRAILETRPDRDKTEERLRALIKEFRNPDCRPDAPAGMRWVAATLEHAIDRRIPFCNEWPDVGEPWFDRVQVVANELEASEIPPHLVAGAKNLFRHMILQNAGVYRRHAIETIVASGWSEPLARVLGYLLQEVGDEGWLRIRAESGLGSLQTPDLSVATYLTRASMQAFKNLNLDKLPDDQSPSRTSVTELHAALFAVGDCFGVEGAMDYANIAREPLLGVLTELASLEGPRAMLLRQATRAAAYTLTFTAQPSKAGWNDRSQQLLEKLSHHPDEVTSGLSRWALSFRFAADGAIRPLMAAN